MKYLQIWISIDLTQEKTLTSEKILLKVDELLVRSYQEDGYSTCLHGGHSDADPGLEALEKEAARFCIKNGFAREGDCEEVFILTYSGIAKAKKLLSQHREILVKSTLMAVLEAAEKNNWEFHWIKHDTGIVLLGNNKTLLDDVKDQSLLSEALETLVDNSWIRRAQDELYLVTSEGKLTLRKFEDPDTEVLTEKTKLTIAGRKVFIVHGRDESARLEVEKLIRKLDLEPIVLFEQPNRGRSIIEKFEQESVPVGFAVVLLTPDDIGGIKPETAQIEPVLSARARQNVVFELGFFFGTLGRKNVVALMKGDLEHPSDIHGVVYILMDHAGAWRISLAKEIKEAGITVDLNLL